MTLDEAIEHAREIASTCNDSRCAADHAQLAEWLRELRRARMEIDLLREWLFSACMHMDARQMVIANSSDQRDAMCELGIEVDE